LIMPTFRSRVEHKSRRLGLAPHDRGRLSSGRRYDRGGSWTPVCVGSPGSRKAVSWDPWPPLGSTGGSAVLAGHLSWRPGPDPRNTATSRRSAARAGPAKGTGDPVPRANHRGGYLMSRPGGVCTAVLADAIYQESTACRDPVCRAQKIGGGTLVVDGEPGPFRLGVPPRGDRDA
jgi:hypothetical protein